MKIIEVDLGYKLVGNDGLTLQMTRVPTAENIFEAVCLFGLSFETSGRLVAFVTQARYLKDIPKLAERMGFNYERGEG